MGKRKNNNLTINKIVTYCPRCPISSKLIKLRKNKSALFQARECRTHKHKFKKSDNGVMVSGVPVERFNEMIKPVSLSSQEI